MDADSSIWASNLTAKLARAYATKETIDDVVKNIRQGRCPCCGIRDIDDDEVLSKQECGHYLCYVCTERKHVCLPCAFGM